MKQALHIFAKDARHFWPEIVVSVLVTATYAWIYRYTWIKDMVPATTQVMTLEKLAVLLLILMPVGWWVAITRTTHAESLVGDRQWWITKPYEWPQLLGAKLLFIAVFVLLPFLVAQCLLVEEAGFHWYEYLPGLGLNLMFVLGFLVGPMLALGAVTSGFGKTTLTLLAVLVGLILIGVLSAVFDSGGIASYGDEAGGTAMFLLVLCCCGGAIVLQYARRMAWMSRLLLASMVVPVAAAMCLSAAPKLIAMAYPDAAGASFHMALDPTPRKTLTTDAGSGRVGVPVPLIVSGVDGGSALRVDGMRATVVTAAGKRWTSRWEPVYGALYFPGSSRAQLSMQVDRKFLEAAGSQSLKVDLVLAVTKLKAGEDHVVPMTRSEMTVPGVGICWPSGGWRTEWVSPEGITCRTPLREPPLTYVNVRWPEVTCAANAKDEVPGEGVVGQMVGDASNDPVQFGLTSVWETSVWLQNFMLDTEEGGKIARHPPLLCPGTPIHFTRYTVAGRMQYDVRLDNFKAPPLRGTEAGVTVGFRVF